MGATTNVTTVHYGTTWDDLTLLEEVKQTNLELERTVSYEVGVEHQFTDTLMMDVTGFYKDITNLAENEFIEIGADSYNLAVNADYGNVRGVEVIVKKRPGKYVSGKLSYTYAIAKGRSSGYGLGYEVSYWQQIMPQQDCYLDWDQRHTVNLNVDFRIPKGRGWGLGSVKPLSDFGINILAYYGSGMPYTGEAMKGRMPNFNTKRYLPTSNVNLRISKRFHILSLDYTLFAEVYNVFSEKNMLAAKDLSLYERYQDPDGRSDDPFIWGPPRWMYAGVSVGF